MGDNSINNSLEDQTLQSIEQFAGAHSTFPVDLKQQFDGVSIQIGVETSEVADFDYFFEEDVEFPTSVSGQVVVFDHCDDVIIAKFTDFFHHLANH